MSFKDDVEKEMMNWIQENCWDMPSTERMKFAAMAGNYMALFTSELILKAFKTEINRLGKHYSYSSEEISGFGDAIKFIESYIEGAK